MLLTQAEQTELTCAAAEHVITTLGDAPPVNAFDWISLIMLLIQFLKDRFGTKLAAFDWMAIIQLLLPIIQALIERWMNKKTPTPTPDPIV